MFMKKIIVLLVVILITPSIVGCKKDTSDIINSDTSYIANDSSQNAGDGITATNSEELEKNIPILTSKAEIQNFSKTILSNIKDIFDNYNLTSTLTSNNLKLYHFGYYEKLGKNYEVIFEADFNPYLSETEEQDVYFSYEIQISGNANILDLNLPEINALIDIMLLSDEFKEKFSRDELLTRLEKDFNGESSIEEEIFSFKNDVDCKKLRGYFSLGSAFVKGGVPKEASVYEFDYYDDYDTFAEKANEEVFNTMKSIGLIENDQVLERGKDKPISAYVNGTPLLGEEAYIMGMTKNYTDNFSVEYSLAAKNMEFDPVTNTLTDTKYLDQLIDLLNSSEYYKNKLNKDEFMSAIYDKSRGILDNCTTTIPVNLDGVESLEVVLNGDRTRLGFQVTFSSPAIVEGQEAR